MLNPACLSRRLEIAPDSIQHLELEPLGGDLLPVGKLPGVLDDLLVVGSDPGVVPFPQQPLHQPHVVPVHVFLVGKGDGWGLEIGALAEPHSGLEPDEIADVALRSGEAPTGSPPRSSPDRIVEQPLVKKSSVFCVYSELSMSRRTKPLSALALSRIRIMFAWQRFSSISMPIWVSLTETLTSLPGLSQPVEHLQVLIAGRDRLRLYGDAFAQEIERRGDAALGQLSRSCDGLIDGFSCDETGGELPGEPIASDEIEDSALLR